MTTLEQRIVEILDGYFRYSLDVRLDEDIPAAAADVAGMVATVAAAPAPPTPAAILEAIGDEPTNDIDATGHCCCAGCIGMGPCDLDPVRSDGDEQYDLPADEDWLTVPASRTDTEETT